MFFNNQKTAEKTGYIEMLKMIGSLSNLFSESDVPYLYYRIAEKIFCNSFNAMDLSRSDVSADAKKNTLGIGLKTFIFEGKNSYQKIAEFNKERPIYEKLNEVDLIKKISELRNARIEFTKRVHRIDSFIYHCVLRDKGVFKIFEEKMENINIEKINNVKKSKNSIKFEDGLNEYSFLISKSTLTKKFSASEFEHEFDVKIISDPFEQLLKCFKKKEKEIGIYGKRIEQTIFLPLSDNKRKLVPPKSGLNQWNAGGRKRHPDEVYIRIPAQIHKFFPDFFPNRETPFALKLSDGKIVQAKICQDGGKALMSYNNKDIGNWILRDVLKLKEGTLVTYELLQILGIDSVRIDKVGNLEYEINFAALGKYEEFESNYLND
ncbi:MAG: NgoFVII family restriction endonuclease [bacterium]